MNQHTDAHMPTEINLNVEQFFSQDILTRRTRVKMEFDGYEVKIDLHYLRGEEDTCGMTYVFQAPQDVDLDLLETALRDFADEMNIAASGTEFVAFDLIPDAPIESMSAGVSLLY